MITEGFAKWTCDLCGKTVEIFGIRTPDGWARLSIQSRHVPDKCVCDECCKQMDNRPEAVKRCLQTLSSN